MRLTVTVTLAFLVLSPLGHAQVFPPDSDFEPFLCGDQLMTDRHLDDPSFLGPLDLVGTTARATGLRAWDDDFLYLRIRVDADPTTGSDLISSAWGVAFDIDGAYDDFEIVALADGIDAAVSLYENDIVMSANDPFESFDNTPAATFPFNTHGQVTSADSMTGGDDDFFIDFAVPWTELASLGLLPDTPIAVWVASSDVNTALTGDYACFDGPDGLTLTGSVSIATAADTQIDGDGDGYSDADEIESGSDPQDPDSVPGSGSGDGRLEGGGGCRAASASTSFLSMLLLALALGSIRRRRRPALPR